MAGWREGTSTGLETVCFPGRGASHLGQDICNPSFRMGRTLHRCSGGLGAG
jgi:hypothetical protein